MLLRRDEATNVKLTRFEEETSHPLAEAVILNELNTSKHMRNLWTELFLDGLMKASKISFSLSLSLSLSLPLLPLSLHLS